MTKKAVGPLPIQMSVPATLAAWLVPGAGHWLLGRRLRAVVLFITIQALFWTGVAIGGVFTVNPREQQWWSRAQMCAGASGLFCYQRQKRVFEPYRMKAETMVRATGPERTAQVINQARILAAEDDLALVPPADGPAYVFTGVAGMLNLLCIMDVILLCALGQRGEGPIVAPTKEDAA